MAFAIHSTDDGRVPGLEYLPAGGLTPKAGMLLKMTSGALAAAAGADKPLYFSMAQREEACETGELIPVIRVQEDMILETETPSGFTAKAGDKVQLSTDGTGIVKTTGGAAEVVSTTAEKTRVRIVEKTVQAAT